MEVTIILLIEVMEFLLFEEFQKRIVVLGPEGHLELPGKVFLMKTQMQ